MTRFAEDGRELGSRAIIAPNGWPARNLMNFDPALNQLLRAWTVNPISRAARL